MDYLQVITLSLVEGVTEFLPISSTGHLVLFSHLLQIPQTNFFKTFEIFIQLGAILAVVWLYRDTLLHQTAVWKKLLMAFVPTAVLGLIFYTLIKTLLLGNTFVTLAALFVGGVLLIVLELFYQEKDYHIAKISDLSFKKAFLIGIFQSVSMIPGVSRAAATISGGLLLGLNRQAAVEFSFLLAVPTMFAATGLDLFKSNLHFSSQELLFLTLGFIGSFMFASMAIKFLLKFIQHHTFVPFGIYRIILAVVFYYFYIGV